MCTSTVVISSSSLCGFCTPRTFWQDGGGGRRGRQTNLEKKERKRTLISTQRWLEDNCSHASMNNDNLFSTKQQVKTTMSNSNNISLVILCRTSVLLRLCFSNRAFLHVCVCSNFSYYWTNWRKLHAEMYVLPALLFLLLLLLLQPSKHFKNSWKRGRKRKYSPFHHDAAPINAPRSPGQPNKYGVCTWRKGTFYTMRQRYGNCFSALCTVPKHRLL